MNNETKIQEIFKDIPNYKGMYKVSNLGRVKSLGRICGGRNNSTKTLKERILKPSTNKGYLIVVLSKKCIKKLYQIHQLVAISFLNHKPNGHNLVCNHINFNKQDNRVENIEIVTSRENTNLKHLKSTSKYVGVFWYKQSKKWASRIWINGKQRHLGYFINEYDAHLVYQNKLKEITL